MTYDIIIKLYLTSSFNKCLILRKLALHYFGYFQKCLTYTSKPGQLLVNLNSIVRHFILMKRVY